MSESQKTPPAEPADARARQLAARRMHPGSIAREVSLIFVLVLLLVLGCVLLAGAVPLVQQNLYVLVAAVFVGVPYVWLRHTRANFDHFGLTYAGAWRGVRWGLLFSTLTLIPFAVGYTWWQQSVLDHKLHYSADNFYQWPLELKGRPAGWTALSSAGADAPAVGAGKVWVWTQDAALHVGLAAGQAPVDLYLQANRALTPTIYGPAAVVDGHESANARINRTTIRLEQPNARAELIFKYQEGEPPPRSLKIHAKNLTTGESIAVLQGPQEAPSSGVLSVQRGLMWVVLWLLTELIFIALPEEFFYRGYLMTRLKHFFDMRVLRRAPHLAPAPDAPPIKRRRFLGISAENLLVSLLFALGHVLIPIGGVLMLSRASVFFPSLAFGWLRERTDSIVAPVVYHAAANMMVLLAAPHFF